MATTPAGWYPYGNTGEQRYWTGSAWSNTQPDDPKGVEKFEIAQGEGTPKLMVFENEVWRVMPNPSETLGGSLSGATAEVIVQNQLKLGSGVSRTKTLGGIMLRVDAPTFSFSYSLDYKWTRTQSNLEKLNQIAAHINSRSRQLAPQTSVPPSSVTTPVHSVADQIAQFAALHAQGILTDAEFSAKKAQLLGL